MEALFEIIRTINKGGAKVNPTEIYNEGWMTRLLVHYSVKEKLTLRNEEREDMIDFGNISNWTSEALISSPFVGAKNKPEGYTHADMVLGDFNVDYSVSGRLEVEERAKLFGIIEAKMKSPLSKGTNNAKNFNQASRNVACIAANTEENCKTFFYVVLPESKRDHVKRDSTTIKDLVNIEKIGEQIKKRVKSHNEVNKSNQIDKNLIERVKQCKVEVITYEDWIKAFNDDKIKKELNEFYDKCRLHNKIK